MASGNELKPVSWMERLVRNYVQTHCGSRHENTQGPRQPAMQSVSQWLHRVTTEFKSPRATATAAVRETTAAVRETTAAVKRATAKRATVII